MDTSTKASHETLVHKVKYLLIEERAGFTHYFIYLLLTNMSSISELKPIPYNKKKNNSPAKISFFFISHQWH